jgi:cell division protein ZapA (FtsZ GTPase activity inhibitor)
MKFTVTWKPSALNDLAEVWLHAQDQQEVADASDEIDRRLKRQPLQEGESRTGTERILIIAPLVVTYDVSVDDCLVTVTAVWRHR